MPRIEGDGEVSAPQTARERDALEETRRAEQARAATAQPAAMTREPTGAERSAEAVASASRQQDRGEDWKRYAGTAGVEVPTSVADKAKEARAAEQTDEARDELRRVSAQDLLNELKLQSGKVRG